MKFIQNAKSEISEKRLRKTRSDSPFFNADTLTAAEGRGEDALQQYVADVFLTSANGSIKNGYQIDFNFDNLKDAQAFCDIVAAFDVFPKLTQRGDSIIVYIKSREDICNLLALVGASKALMDLNNEIALRDVRSNANRRANCDSGNITKQVETAAVQIEHIRKLDLEYLDPKLRVVAQTRLDNPDATYEELAVLLSLTKSGLVHRMRKIMTNHTNN